MEDYDQNDDCVVGSIREENDSTIEWTLKGFRTFFRRWTPNVLLMSQKFQMIDATWILALYFDQFNGQEGLFVSVRRHQYDIRPRSTVTCHVVVRVGDFELGDYVRNMPVKKRNEICGPVRSTWNLLSLKYLDFRYVRVLCTFSQEVEVRTTEKLSTDVPEHGIRAKKKTEGIYILLSQMENLFLSQENGDFAIAVKDKEFQVHKAILSARAPILAGILQRDMEEKNSNVTEIADCEPDIFEQFLLYLYTSKVGKLSSEKAASLYSLGHKYDIEHLMKVCAKYMAGNLCVEKFCDTIRLGWRHDLPLLVKSAENFFLQNAVEILETPKWQLLMTEYPAACRQLYISFAKSM